MTWQSIGRPGNSNRTGQGSSKTARILVCLFKNQESTTHDIQDQSKLNQETAARTFEEEIFFNLFLPVVLVLEKIIINEQK
jgi:hypothetical protein